jgi:ribosomal protein S18 acetylase RimI-like enzyme
MMTRIQRDTPLSVHGTDPPPPEWLERIERDVALDCGWGRLFLGQTFDDPARIAAGLRSEKPGRRDIAIYVRDPHVVVAQAPQELFVDPSFTYRLWLDELDGAQGAAPRVTVRGMASEADGDAMNRLFTEIGMVTAPPAVMWKKQQSRAFVYLVAVELGTRNVVGTVMGLDHVASFDDPEQGSSLWTLSVSPQCGVSGVGEALTRALARRVPRARLRLRRPLGHARQRGRHRAVR